MTVANEAYEELYQVAGAHAAKLAKPIETYWLECGKAIAALGIRPNTFEWTVVWALCQKQLDWELNKNSLKGSLTSLANLINLDRQPD